MQQQQMLIVVSRLLAILLKIVTCRLIQAQDH
jgi:hypothetical protein